MVKTVTATSARAPHGTKVVAEACLSAVDEIPEPQRADVVTAALALIRDRLREARDKAKSAKEKQKAKGPKAPIPSKTVAPPKAAAKKAAASAKVEKSPAERGKAPQTKAPRSASTLSDEARKPTIA
jgi:hypothetical protein